MNIGRYILRRLGLAIVVFLGSITVTFIVARIIPSNLAALYAGARPTAEQVAKIETEMGLNKPLVVQFFLYLGQLSHGELGQSFLSRQPIINQLKVFLPATLELVSVSTFLSLLIGVPAGVISAANHNRLFDHLTRVISIGGVSIPSFWLALLVQLLFFRYLHLLPIGGRIDNMTALNHPVQYLTGFYLIDTFVSGNWIAFRNTIIHLILPACVLSAYPISLATRMTRSVMVEILSENHIRAARAAGLSERIVLYQYALKNAISPTLTVLGLSAAYSITGAFLVEAVFMWPGVGKYLANAVISADFPVIVAVTQAVTICYIVINLVVDLIQAAIDPRITLS
jgi:peptide/nickel transport system permease protein